MQKSVADIRIDYSKKRLDIIDVALEPIAQFRKWFQEAIDAKVPEPNAMNLATVSPEGKPASRIVLLKGIEDAGLTFFTNYQSRKGNYMAGNPWVALTFFWPELERQVRVEGKVEKAGTELSDKYFRSRPRNSQIGAWASPQSQAIDSRKALEERTAEIEQVFEGKEVQRPTHWGGYLVVPQQIEFWQGRPSRLHDRILYMKENGKWKMERLAP